MAYSDDDVLNIDSGDDNLYSDDGTDSDYGFAEENMTNASTSKRSQLDYVVLKEEDIRKRQQDEIERVSTVLSLSQVEAIVLLLHYHWNVSKVEDEWFTDENRVRNLVGLLKNPSVNGREEAKIECGICFESYTQKKISMVSCGHPYCITCWTSYITTIINDGLGCLRVKCPEPSCSVVIGQDMINKVTKEEDKKKYYRYFLRSYVEEGKNKIKWCPSPGCEYAIALVTDNESTYDVTCLCSYSFCWKCCEDAHRPVDCGTVEKWIMKNNNEAENTNWILAYSKPCPKCKRPIEKNKGCMHMTCSAPCRHQFCWLCLNDYANHKTCNKFESSDDEQKRKRAKKSIDKYTHYYERWTSNQSSRLKAIGDLEKLQSEQLTELSNRQCTPETMLQFIVNAWLQIIECRRVLKWTFAYGYYLPENEKAKKSFFEYLQGEAESGLERLHHCAEMEFNQFVHKTEAPRTNFDDFRKKLTDLTKVTKTYFENLVKALENGLADVEAIYY